MTDIVKNAIAEKHKLKQELQEQLAQHPISRKIRMLDDIITNFGTTVTSKIGTTKLEQIHELAKSCIAANGGYAKLAEIHGYVNRHGMKVKIGMVKSYMYKYTDLDSSRDKGFSIKAR